MRIRTLLVIAALTLTGCDRPKQAADSAQKAPTPSAPHAKAAPKVVSPSAVPPAALTEQPGELPLEDLTGIWRVTAVVPDQTSEFTENDTRIVGSLIDVLPDQIRWSYKASDRFASDEVCLGPVAGIIDDAEYAEKARKLVAPAVTRLKAKVPSLSKPHQWLCGDGGSWGDDTEFQKLADGKVAMRWTGGVTLILDRIRKVADNPPPLPPTGAYESE